MIKKMVDYGSILTGREFGIQVYAELKPMLKYPVELDFQGVSSLGSSFGDEIIPPIAKEQGNSIKIHNVNGVVKTAINNVADDADLKIIFLP